MLVRTRAWVETLASGGRSCGRAAAREEGRADGWGYPVSDCVRERAQGAGSVRAGLGQSQAGQPKEHNVCFFFLLCKIMMYV